MAERGGGGAPGSGLSPEREQEIRQMIPGRGVQPGADRFREDAIRDLLAEIDRLRADQEQLREAGERLEEAVALRPFTTEHDYDWALAAWREALAGVSGSPEREDGR